jgi:hypothetical protein
VKSFTSVDSFTISSRPGQRCYSVRERWTDTEMWDPSKMLGDTVLLDGREVVVRGVEMNRPYISPSQPYRGTIAILVDDITHPL